MKKNFKFSLLSGFLFFLILFFTLKDYGISWDETLHFRRGQAYLHYFLTGEENYGNFPEGYNRSYYQNDTHNGEFWLNEDSGHPPLNGEIAAVFNYIFFQKLNILSDIHSYHLFNILASSLLVFVVVYFVYQELGLFPSIVSFITISTYPLFFAESHFNVKDPPLAAFYAATIWAFYNSVIKKSWKWLLLTFVFLTLTLGTKFNVLFMPFIILPWLFVRFKKQLKNLRTSISKIPIKYKRVLLIGPFVVLLIFIGTWPFIWRNFPNNLLSIFGWYKDIGTHFRYQPDSFFIFGFNTFPVQWILFTTPPLTLVLSVLGILFAIKNIKQKNVYLLWFLWLFVPILRVTLPNTTIYGGIRQIMEFVPAMAILSGVGAYFVLEKAKKKFKKIENFKKIFLLTCLSLSIIPLIKHHPNENVYFNFLIGGLNGAKQRNFPSWGNSFGNTYLNGINWLNKNAENGASASLIQGTVANAPEMLFKNDINYGYSNFSGIERKGEYLMELIFNDTIREFNYSWEYVEKFLEPVYEYKVDGVTILSIWKNDLDYTKEEYKDLSEYKYSDYSYNIEENLLTIDFNREERLSRINIKYNSVSGCFPITNSYVEISSNGDSWDRKNDIIPDKQLYKEFNLDKDNNSIQYFFAGDNAKKVRFWFDNKDSCGLNLNSINIMILK